MATYRSSLAAARPSSGQNHAANDAYNALAQSSASFIVQPSPITANDQLPVFAPLQMSPTHKRRHELLEREPEDSVEKDYQDALHESYNREARLKMEVIGLHAAGVLNGIYCNRLHSQLAAQEEKEQNAKKKKRQIDGGWLTKVFNRRRVVPTCR
jgi:hypothetical protein